MFIPNHDFCQMNAHRFRARQLIQLSAKITIKEFWQQASLWSQSSFLNLGTNNSQLKRLDILLAELTRYG